MLNLVTRLCLGTYPPGYAGKLQSRFHSETGPQAKCYLVLRVAGGRACRNRRYQAGSGGDAKAPPRRLPKKLI